MYLVPFILFLVVVVISLINFINFMDGLDGLVAGCMLVAIAVLSFILHFPWCIWTLCGSLFGFLYGIGVRSRSLWVMLVALLGAVFAGLVFQATSWADSIAFLLLATPLLADACFCVARRLIAGQRISAPSASSFPTFAPVRLVSFNCVHDLHHSNSCIRCSHGCWRLALGAWAGIC